MDFEFSEEQRMVQRTIRDFCSREVAPLVRQIDDRQEIPAHLIKGLADLRVLGMTVSPEYGGMDADPVTAGLAAEELARADISCAIPTFFLVPAAWGYILNRYGHRRARADILPLVTAGTAFLGVGTTEPNAGSDLGAMVTTARQEGDSYVLKGEKVFVSGVRESMEQLPDGGGYLTLAKTNPSLGTRGLGLFYVPVKNKKGVTSTLIEDWGRRGISSGGFALDDVTVPSEYLIGAPERGFYLAMEGFDLARGIISVVCCAAAMSALEQAMTYLKSRRAFGQPIARFEGVQFKLAEHWAKLDAARLLAYRALWMYGREQRSGASSRFDVSRACAEAKMLAPQFAFEAINDAIQWFGAFGYTVECPLQLGLKGVRSYFWAEGALEVMKIIVARELLGKEYVAYR